MAISDWFKKSKNDETEIEPLRRKDETAIEEISVKEKFESAIHCGGKHIVINEDIILTETLEIDVDDITIDGQGYTIFSTSRNAQMFVITSNNVTLKNIIFKNGNSNRDGGAINNLNGKLDIINCEFRQNNAHDGNGGAIYNYQGKVSITGCRFIDNHTDKIDGGAIFNFNGEINVEDCEFEANDSKKFGGAIYNGKTLNLKDTTFKNNRGIKGLAIFNTSEATLENCEFIRDDENDLRRSSEIHNLGFINIEGDKKENIESNTKGGFIHIKNEQGKSFKYLESLLESGAKEIKLDCDIINKEFKTGISIDGNDITIDGADYIIDGLGKAIFNINGENITLKNINFRNGSTSEGGAINNQSSSLKMVNCNFDYNISNKGGAISNDGSMELENCNFTKNIANESDGGAINNRGELTLEECNFKNNTSQKNGGAINNINLLALRNCEFNSNRSKINGASINNEQNASVEMMNVTFENNISDNKGSVIFNYSNVKMEKCNFSNNISAHESSNIIFQEGDESSNLIIEDCIFSRDKFSNNLIFIENGSCEVNLSTFKFAKERENSYVIYNENGVLTVKNLEFENINSETVFNNNVIYLEKNMEKYIKSGDKGLPYNYL